MNPSNGPGAQAPGIAPCLEPLETRLLLDAGDVATAILVDGDGRVYCLSEDGDTFVIQAGPEFELLGKNSLGELCMATPAIVRDGLIIRTESHLLRIQ